MSFHSPCRFAGSPPRPRAGDEQVAPVLEEEHLELGVLRRRGLDLALVEGQRPLCVAGGAEFERDAVEQRLVVGHVRRFQIVVGFGRGGGDRGADPRVGIVAAVALRVVHRVVGPGGKEKREAVAVLERDGVAGDLHRAAVVQDGELRLVPEAVGQRAGEAEQVPRGPGRRAVRVGQRDRAGVGARLVGGQPRDEDAGRVAAEIFPPEVGAVALVAHVRQGPADVEVAPVAGDSRVLPGQRDVELPKRLVGAEIVVVLLRRLVETGGIIVAGPEAILIEADALAVDAAEDQAAESAIADRQGLAHGVLGGLVVPQLQVSRGRVGRDSEEGRGKRGDDESNRDQAGRAFHEGMEGGGGKRPRDGAIEYRSTEKTTRSEVSHGAELIPRGRARRRRLRLRSNSLDSVVY